MKQLTNKLSIDDVAAAVATDIQIACAKQATYDKFGKFTLIRRNGVLAISYVEPIDYGFDEDGYRITGREHICSWSDTDGCFSVNSVEDIVE